MDTCRDEIIICLSGEIKPYCLITYLTQWLLLGLSGSPSHRPHSIRSVLTLTPAEVSLTFATQEASGREGER